MNARLTFVHAQSPLHAGTGQGVGVIDLPVAREKATNLPFLPGSQLKGTLRDDCEIKHYYQELNNGADERAASAKAKKECAKIFGKPDEDNESGHSGAAIFTDQRLLCLPVRTLLGTFAWVTSPYILERLRRDCQNAEISPNLPTDNVSIAAVETCLVTENPPIVYRSGANHCVVFEDLDLTDQQSAAAVNWAEWIGSQVFSDEEWRKRFNERFCIVHDDVFNFLAETATEVAARNILSDEKKTSENLWYEESLPAESILSGLVVAVKVNGANEAETLESVKTLANGKTLQLGGNATVGRGLCRLSIN